MYYKTQFILLKNTEPSCFFTLWQLQRERSFTAAVQTIKKKKSYCISSESGLFYPNNRVNQANQA